MGLAGTAENVVMHLRLGGLSSRVMSRLKGRMSRPLSAARRPFGAALLLAFATLGFAALSSRSRAAQAAPQEAYLIQNSGWMEPFYLDRRSPFLPLLRAFIGASVLPGARVTIASFNQAGQLGDTPSPLPLYVGPPDGHAMGMALGKLTLPRRADGLYTDADYNGALSDTIPRLLGGAPGVIWMVTNNKNSRSNDQHVVQNTSRFSALLTNSGFISQIVAYPVRLPAQGPTFSERGLVIYGIAYGDQAASWLQQVTGSQAMRRLFVDRPVRLKPLTLDPLTLTLTQSADHGVRLTRAGGAIVIDGLPGASETQVEIPARLTSNYYPQVIDRASLRADWVPEGSGPAIPAGITPQTISAMGPEEALDGVRVHLDVPSIPRAPGLAGLLQGGRQVRGELRLQLTDVHLVLQQAFLDKMRDLFGADAEAAGRQVSGGERQSQLPAALPAVFLGHEAVAAASTSVPVFINVVFSPWPLVLLLGGVALALLAAALLLLACTRERMYDVAVGAETMKVPLRPFRSTTLRSRAGTRVAVTGRLFGQPRVVTIV